MLIGININEHQLWVAGIKSAEEAVIIKDTSSSVTQEEYTPLKIYTEDGFAYVGKVVEPILTAMPNLPVAINFLSDEAFVDEESMTTELLALCLKKIHADIKVFDDADIEGIAISLPQHYTKQQKAMVQLAFEVANLPFSACVDHAIAACHAYQIPQAGNCLIVNWQKENIQLYLLDEQRNTLSCKTFNLLSEKHLDKALLKLIVAQFEKATQEGLSITESNLLQIEAVAAQLLQTFSDQKNKTAKAICYLNNTAVELVITKEIFLNTLNEYQQLLTTTLNEFLSEAGFSFNDVTDVALVGQSNFFNAIIEELRHSLAHQNLHCMLPHEALAKGAALYLSKQHDNNKQTTTIKHLSNDIEPTKLQEIKERITSTLINAYQ